MLIVLPNVSRAAREPWSRSHGDTWARGLSAPALQSTSDPFPQSMLVRFEVGAGRAFYGMSEALAGDRPLVGDLDGILQRVYPRASQDGVGLMAGRPVDAGLNPGIALHIAVVRASASFLLIL
jgi:hypothetical protein